jgi:hypothetical protein
MLQHIRREMRSRVHFAMVGMLLFCAIAMQAHAATITVTNNNDSGPGSLRQALRDANDGDTITFAVGGTITLTSGGLPVTKNVTISGPGADQLSIDGNQALLVLGIFPDKTATISGLTVMNGQIGIWNEGTSTTVSNCVVIGNSFSGLFTGLLSGHGSLIVSNCTVSDNLGLGLYNDHATLNVNNCLVSGNSDGGISNNQVQGPPPPVQRSDGRQDYRKSYGGPSSLEASLTLENSMISGNSGPGVDNNSGVATITNCTISGNSTNSTAQSGEGGGIYTDGTELPGNVTVSNSTISGNFASNGGGGISSGFSGLTIINSTISGNSAGDPVFGYGGGIAAGNVGTTIMNSTISGNSASYSGGGISIGAGTIGNTILNNNSGGNVAGAIISQGYNVSSDDGGGLLNGPGDQINTDPLLGPLQDNGGPTLTHLPLPGSPAIDAGDPNFTSPPLRDQRGVCFYRVFGRRIDVGSVETQPEPRCPSPAPRPTP